MAKKKEEIVTIKQTIIDADFKDVMEDSYLNYSLEVLLSRAVPDIRDGFKPVQRRIIYDMDELKVYYNSQYKKCGRIVGDTMGKYHPHGDSSIYEALVRIAQSWQLNIPLIDGHGNFGNIDGDCAAASRYTECRLSKITNEMLGELKNIVNFIPNFDETEEEPEVLPCKFPNLLVNGSDGIAVGLTTYIPTHNLVEVNNMLIAYLKKDPSFEDKKLGKENPLSNAKLLEILNGPDFPTGGIIVNKKDLLDIYSTGEGKILVRGKVKEETINGKPCLIIYEIPYTSTGRKETLVNKIAELILNKKIEDVNEVRDESDKEGIRIVVEMKKGADFKKVENKLYKLSPLQDTYTVRLVAVRKNGIKNFSLKEYCKEFIDFQREIYLKEYQVKLAKAIAKSEILEGLVIARDYIDIIIDAIRHAEKVEYAKRCLMTGNTSNIKWQSKKNEQTAKKFSFTEAQAENILSTTLRRLNNLEFDEIQNNLDSLRKEIENYKNIIADSKLLDKSIITKLQSISKEYGTPRKTEIMDTQIVLYKEEKKYENCNILYDKYGYIKLLDDSNYSKLEEIAFENCKLNTKTTTEDKLWCFSNKGNIYQLKLDGITFNKTKDRGFFLESKLGNNKIEGEIIFVTTQNTIKKKLIFITKKGFVKIVDNSEFISTRTITQSTKLSPDDEILKIIEIDENLESLFVLNSTMYLKFAIKEISEMKKIGVGVVSIKTEENLIDAFPIYKDTKEIKLLNGKIFKVDTLKTQKRGSKGTKY